MGAARGEGRGEELPAKGSFEISAGVAEHGCRGSVGCVVGRTMDGVKKKIRSRTKTRRDATIDILSKRITPACSTTASRTLHRSPSFG